MQERTVTLDGKTHPLSDRFTVVATQNPIEQQGTYPLPEAQLDRFLFKQMLAYPSEEEERGIVAATARACACQTQATWRGTRRRPRRSADRDRRGWQRSSMKIVDYIVRLVRATREAAAISHGASPRAAAMLATAARARAALDGRDYVIPDDVKALAPPALRHRVILRPPPRSRAARWMRC